MRTRRARPPWPGTSSGTRSSSTASCGWGMASCWAPLSRTCRSQLGAPCSGSAGCPAANGRPLRAGGPAWAAAGDPRRSPGHEGGRRHQHPQRLPQLRCAPPERRDRADQVSAASLTRWWQRPMWACSLACYDRVRHVAPHRHHVWLVNACVGRGADIAAPWLTHLALLVLLVLRPLAAVSLCAHVALHLGSCQRSVPRHATAALLCALLVACSARTCLSYARLFAWFCHLLAAGCVSH
jgi:hypothetical protein